MSQDQVIKMKMSAATLNDIVEAIESANAHYRIPFRKAVPEDLERGQMAMPERPAEEDAQMVARYLHEHILVPGIVRLVSRNGSLQRNVQKLQEKVASDIASHVQVTIEE